MQRITIEPATGHGYNAWLETKGLFFWRREPTDLYYGWGYTRGEAEQNLRNRMLAIEDHQRWLDQPTTHKEL
jgi:hypothetical protein